MNGWSRLYKAYWTTRWVTNRFSGEANFSQELNDHLWPFGCVITSIQLQSECYCWVRLQKFWRWWFWGMNSNIGRLSALILKLLAIVGLNMFYGAAMLYSLIKNSFICQRKNAQFNPKMLCGLQHHTSVQH